MNKKILEINNLYKTYEKDETPALNDLSLSLDEGKIYALIGSSGCGKSTLLNIIGTLDTYDKGDIYFEGNNYEKIDSQSNFRLKNIGFVFQFHHLIPTLTLQENVEAAMIDLKVIKKATQLLDTLGLKLKKNTLASKVSGGEKQRTAIVRALINEPKLVLADEPTGNVDSKTTKLILNELSNFIKKEKKTILIATHDLEVARFADVILEMSDGKIISIKNNKD